MRTACIKEEHDSQILNVTRNVLVVVRYVLSVFQNEDTKATQDSQQQQYQHYQHLKQKRDHETSKTGSPCFMHKTLLASDMGCDSARPVLLARS